MTSGLDQRLTCVVTCRACGRSERVFWPVRKILAALRNEVPCEKCGDTDLTLSGISGIDQ